LITSHYYGPELKKWIGSRELTRLLDWPKIYRMPNRLVVSETNNGKTALVRQFITLHTPQPNIDGEAAIVPVIYIQSPPVPDERRFYAALLDAIGMVHRRSQRSDELFYQVRTLLPKIGLKMIIIDEIHHILAGSTKQHRAFLNTIKYLGNELLVPIVAVGTQQALYAVQSDHQIENRFPPIELPRWRCDNHWRQLLATFERRLPLRNASDLPDKRLAERLHLMSEGTIGELASLLRSGAIESIRGGEERICDAVLDRLRWQVPSHRRKHALAVI
jgi:hypothetical protein